MTGTCRCSTTAILRAALSGERPPRGCPVHDVDEPGAIAPGPEAGAIAPAADDTPTPRNPATERSTMVDVLAGRPSRLRKFLGEAMANTPTAPPPTLPLNASIDEWRAHLGIPPTTPED